MVKFSISFYFLYEFRAHYVQCTLRIFCYLLSLMCCVWKARISWSKPCSSIESTRLSRRSLSTSWKTKDIIKYTIKSLFVLFINKSMVEIPACDSEKKKIFVTIFKGNKIKIWKIISYNIIPKKSSSSSTYLIVAYLPIGFRWRDQSELLRISINQLECLMKRQRQHSLYRLDQL